MIAITLPSAEIAQAVSRGMWRLSRPEAIRNGDATLYLAEVVGNVLVADPEWELPIHPLVISELSDPADASGTQSLMAALLMPLLREPAGLGRVVALLMAGGVLRVGDVIAELRPELIGNPPTPEDDP